jgi:hypothetical protein
MAVSYWLKLYLVTSFYGKSIPAGVDFLSFRQHQ